MKHFFWGLLVMFSACTNADTPVTKQSAAQIDLLSPFFNFENAEPAGSVLNQSAPEGSFKSNANPEKGFAIKFIVDIKAFKDTINLITLPGVMTVDLRMADPQKRDRQNYPAFTMEDGSLPVLEAQLILHSLNDRRENQYKEKDSREITIGCPLAMLPNPFGKHEVVINFTGSKWTMYVDNELMDNDFPIGYPLWPENQNWNIDPAIVEKAEIFFPALKATRDIAEKNTARADLLFWTPKAHNAWVGDVATIYFKDRYHVFYLFDRRHHSSKLGAGGHYFEHFSSKDFKTWTEHEAVVPIDEQWETIGTGSPFIYEDKVHLSYGLHTSRIYTGSLTMSPKQLAYYNQHKQTGILQFNLDEGYPSGASYVSGDDNADKFKKSRILYHFCENPSIFTLPDGQLRLFANGRSRGTWRSPSLDSGWTAIDPDFPLGGDCTFYFQWGDYEYINGGFGSMWRRALNTPEGPWTDVVAEGKDFYNGINVPSVSPISDNRYVMAGWIPITGWGGPFVMYELIQQPDGRLGTKWMKELIPDEGEVSQLAEELTEASSFEIKDQSFLLSFDVEPEKENTGRLAIAFSSATGEQDNACEFQIDLEKLRAQYSKLSEAPFSAIEKSLREGGSPSGVGNYAIENLMGTDKPFSVRMLIKSNAKLGGTLIDTEIAGLNTMITYRNAFTMDRMNFHPEQIRIKNVRIMKMRN